MSETLTRLCKRTCSPEPSLITSVVSTSRVWGSAQVDFMLGSELCSRKEHTHRMRLGQIRKLYCRTGKSFKMVKREGRVGVVSWITWESHIFKPWGNVNKDEMMNTCEFLQSRLSHFPQLRDWYFRGETSTCHSTLFRIALRVWTCIIHVKVKVWSVINNGWIHELKQFGIVAGTCPWIKFVNAGDLE